MKYIINLTVLMLVHLVAIVSIIIFIDNPESHMHTLGVFYTVFYIIILGMLDVLLFFNIYRYYTRPYFEYNNYSDNIFLGRYKYKGIKYDLYYYFVIPTLIVKYGNGITEYTRALVEKVQNSKIKMDTPHAMPLYETLKRAIKRGYIL